MRIQIQALVSRYLPPSLPGDLFSIPFPGTFPTSCSLLLSPFSVPTSSPSLLDVLYCIPPPPSSVHHSLSIPVFSLSFPPASSLPSSSPVPFHPSPRLLLFPFILPLLSSSPFLSIITRHTQSCSLCSHLHLSSTHVLFFLPPSSAPSDVPLFIHHLPPLLFPFFMSPLVPLLFPLAPLTYISIGEPAGRLISNSGKTWPQWYLVALTIVIRDR